ncbi:very short patch repair endonuclease [Agromyces larvae]|uniref:very short patch repair endonuclease n=1 Tax=Agromyces larvae TaxID=2929802 RepID=UPI00338EB413
MRAIKRTDTGPERAIRSELHARGFRFRKDMRLQLATGVVRPDIVFTRKRVAIFIDGCFWHSCPLHSRPPSVNSSYWGPKLARTVERDLRANDALVNAGWYVIRVWEHVPPLSAADSIEHVFDHRANRSAADVDPPFGLILLG